MSCQHHSIERRKKDKRAVDLLWRRMILTLENPRFCAVFRNPGFSREGGRVQMTTSNFRPPHLAHLNIYRQASFLTILEFHTPNCADVICAWLPDYKDCTFGSEVGCMRLAAAAQRVCIACWQPTESGRERTAAAAVAHKDP